MTFIEDISSKLKYRRLILIDDMIISIEDNGFRHAEFYVYIVKYKTELAAKIHFDIAVQSGLWIGDGNYNGYGFYQVETHQEVITSSLKKMQEFGLDFCLSSHNREMAKYGYEYNLTQQEVLNVYEVLKNKTIYYCEVCGTKLPIDNKLCYACDKGI